MNDHDKITDKLAKDLMAIHETGFTQDEIIEMAREVDCLHVNLTGDRAKALERLEAFAKLVAAKAAAKEREKTESEIALLKKCLFQMQEAAKAISQLESQEPVAILNHAHGVYTFRNVKVKGLPDGEFFVYTHPPQRTEQTSAERTLQSLGYTNNGGEYWKPPLGKPRNPFCEPATDGVCEAINCPNHPPAAQQEKTPKTKIDWVFLLEHRFGFGALSQRDIDIAVEVERMVNFTTPPAQPAQPEPVNRYCCNSCFRASGSLMFDRMILCYECGNKRCPKASNHQLDCTGSNESGQVGSIFPATHGIGGEA